MFGWRSGQCKVKMAVLSQCSHITEQNLIWYVEKLQWEFSPVPRVLFTFPYFYSHSHSNDTVTFTRIPMGSPRDPWDPNCSHTHAQLCFTDIMIYWLKICICSLFLPTPVSFKALAKRVLLGPSVPRLPDSENWLLGLTQYQSSSSRMRVINHNWSATKQHPHPQSVAEISRHSVLSGDRIRQCETSSGSRHKDTDQCL